MRWNSLPLAVALFLNASRAFGNCEVGGYLIHTLAGYKPHEPHRVVLPYWKEGGGRLGFAPNYVEGEPVNALASPALRLEHAGAACTKPSYSSVERYRAPHDIQHRLDTTGCSVLLENLPTHGYAFVDTTKPAISFTDALPIDFVSLGEEDLASLEREIAAQLPHLPLYAESGPGEQEGRGKIDASHIRGIRLESTTATYAGDGSWCASVGVGDLLGRGGRPAPERPSDTLLGAVERFRLTGAFDVDDDGAPDVLEVNARFAYLLEPDGRFYVIRFGAGC